MSNQEFVQSKPNPWRSILEFILELVKVIAISASIIILVRWLFFQPFYVKGFSMEPNFSDGDYLIIYQLPYRFSWRFHQFTVDHRGTAVIFHPPNDPKQFYIKRLIGLPGERVKIDDGRIRIYNNTNPEGFILKEDYLPERVKTLSGTYNDVQLSLDQIFVLGDNRTHSLDSRRLGPIPIANVIGEPILRGWPLDKVGIVRKPTY